jgi:hypothetical protein
MTTVSSIMTSRRRLLGSATAAGIGISALGQDATASGDSALPARRTTFQEDSAVVTGTMPNWSVVVHAFQNPYQGRLAVPAQPDPAKRYIGADVEVRNDSDRPLAISPGQFRLRGTDAVDYLAGGVVGEDPRLLDANMLPGEKARGWVYFAVPDAVEIDQLVYAPPAPQILMPVPGTTDEGTPTA